MTIKVAIVEDVQDIRIGLSLIINGSDGFECLHTYSSAEDGIKSLPNETIDVVLMDINLPGINGIDCIKILKPQMPHTQFMMCTVYEDDEQVFQSLKSGASGYILKKTAPIKLLEAITEIHNGCSPMSSVIARKVISAMQIGAGNTNTHNLSDREMEILNALSKGHRYKEVADKLFISIDTVRSHIRNIYEKLEVNSRTDAVNKVFPRA